jgi:3-methyladenine DNA glycosylase AlkC
MVSTSNKSQIHERASYFFSTLSSSIYHPHENEIEGIYITLSQFLQQEYNAIPEKERIGKGSVFIARAIANDLLAWFSDQCSQAKVKTDVIIIKFTRDFVGKAIKNDDTLMTATGIYFLAEYLKQQPDTFSIAEPLVVVWATNPKWEVREMACEPIINLLQKSPKIILPKLLEWASSADENLRRLATESSRPRAQIKWLRDPTKNQPILDLLSHVRSDPSEYVRKSVGNNIKDLSKYMPERVLTLCEAWNQEFDLIITPDIASKTKKELGASNFYLIWTLKQALRWLQERHPEFHARLEKILGSNYIAYFNEKKNRSSIPDKDLFDND